MGYSSNVVTAPVSFDDIADATNLQSGDLGTLISTGTINKWAVYKPVKYNKTSALTYAERQSTNFGLTAPSVRTSPEATFSDLWVYQRPSGSPNEWFRTLDFNGYFKNAEPPCATVGNITVDLSQVNSFSFGAYIRHPQSGGNTITWGDLPSSVGSYYLCAVFSTGQNCTGTLIAKTSAQTLSDSGITLDLNQSELNTLLNENYKYYYLCARSATLTTLSTPSTTSASYLSLPTATSPSVDVYGGFTIQPSGSLHNIVISKVSNVASPSSIHDFVAADNYVGMEGPDPDQSDYFKVGVNGLYWIHFGFTVTAGSTNFQLNADSIKLSETFYSASGFSSAQSVTLYDSTFTQRNTITISANTSQTVYMVASSPLLSLDSGADEQTGASNSYFSTKVLVMQNSAEITGNDQYIRVRNYDF